MLKKILAIGLMLILGLGLFGTAFAAETTESVITVNGKGTVSVKPDVAMVQIGYEARNASATAAMDEARVKMNAVLKAIKALGVADADIRTTTIGLYRNIEYNNEVKEVFYVATNIVDVKIKNLDLTGKILDAASKAGANTMGSIRLESLLQDKYYKDALKLAAKDAADKADVILGAMGYTRGKAVKIMEGSSGGGIIYREAMTADSAAYSTPIEAGEIKIEAYLTVDYRF